jgi:hypothetical protein
MGGLLEARMAAACFLSLDLPLVSAIGYQSALRCENMGEIHNKTDIDIQL